MQQLPLSVCTIYSEDDSDKLKYCDEPLPGNIERIKLMTQPSGEFGMNLPVVNYRNKNSVNALWKYKTKPFDTFSFSDAKNACKLLASREWILYLDADDVIQWIDSLSLAMNTDMLIVRLFLIEVTTISLKWVGSG